MFLWILIALVLLGWNMLSYLDGKSMRLPFLSLLGFLAFSLALSLLGPNPMGYD